METYESLIHAHYDNDKCYESFVYLLEHPKQNDAIDAAIRASLPVLGRVMGTKFKKIKSGTILYEEILEAVPYSLFIYLASDTFYRKFYCNRTTHFAYLFGLFRHEVLNALNYYRRSLPKELPSFASFPDYYSEYLPSKVELSIFMEQLPKTLGETVETQIRFRDDPDYKICLSAMEAIINGAPIPWFSLREFAKDYNLARIEFLVDHVRILVRKSMLQYGPEFEEMARALGEELTSFRHSSTHEYIFEGRTRYGEIDEMDPVEEADLLETTVEAEEEPDADFG